MKITPKPITASDNTDQSRDASGLNKWSQSSRTIGTIMLILGWFTIPIEVLFRRDFGQRWFTAINFYAGFFLLLIMAMLQYMINLIWEWGEGLISRVASAINPLYAAPEPSLVDSAMDASIAWVLFFYILLGSYHRFKIWWRNRTHTALHSFDDGTSRLEPLAGYGMRLLNVLTIPFVQLYRRLLPKAQRQGVAAPKLINDRTAFTNTVVEPLVLVILAHYFHGITSIWLWISAIAVAIHANWKETAKLNKVLDFRDAEIDARAMMELKNAAKREGAANEVKTPPAAKGKAAQAAADVAMKYPDLMTIIEEMNRDGGHLASSLP
jgi:hypothetical protein